MRCFRTRVSTRSASCARSSAARCPTAATGAPSTSARSRPTSPYDQLSVPGYRQIIDLSPANDSRFLDAVGESGHFLSPHYDDFLADWQAVRHRKMRMDAGRGRRWRARDAAADAYEVVRALGSPSGGPKGPH